MCPRRVERGKNLKVAAKTVANMNYDDLPTPRISPNDPLCAAADDAGAIQRAVDLAAACGGTAIIPALNARTDHEGWTVSRAILLPAGATVLLDGCRLNLAGGVMDNFFRSANAFSGEPRELRAIRLLGRDGAVLAGGAPNGLCEATSLKDGRPHVRRNCPILLANVRDFLIEGLEIRDQQYWGVCLEYCSHGRLAALRFMAHHDRDNQDGIDLRDGCHDIVIEDISGQTGDDMIALSAIDATPRSAVPMGSPDIHDVEIRNVVGAAQNHPLVALRNHNGSRLCGIRVSGLRDTPFDEPARGEEQPRYALVRIGNNRYFSRRPSCMGETFDIALRDLDASHSLRGVVLAATVRDLRIDGLRCHGVCGRAITTDGPLWAGELGAKAEKLVANNVRVETEGGRLLDFDAMRPGDFVTDATVNGENYSLSTVMPPSTLTT